MAGFLDKNTTVIDMVLTGYGKEMLAKNTFDVTYYAFFDDEIDYDPHIHESGSLTATQLSGSKVEEIEMMLVSEPTIGMLHGIDLVALDNTNVNRPLFTMPQGQKVLPIAKYSPSGSSETVELRQRKVVDVYRRKDTAGNVLETIEQDRGYEIVDSSRISVNMSIDDFFEHDSADGCLLRVYLSGSRYVDSDGYVEIDPRRDLDHVISFGDTVRVLLDGEIERFDNVVEKRSNDVNKMKPVSSTGYGKWLAE